MHRYFILNKPAGIVSQFVSTHNVGLLADLDFDFPAGTHAIGRLDNNSEGLLLLTTDKRVTRLIFLGSRPHKRTYLVMVAHKMNEETLQKLRAGIPIRVKDGKFHLAIPQSVQIVADPFALYSHAADDRVKYPHTWLLISLTEGKFHQVRKMVLAVRHRCIRLIRLSMEDLNVNGIDPGKVKEVSHEEFYRLAGISD